MVSIQKIKEKKIQIEDLGEDLIQNTRRNWKFVAVSSFLVAGKQKASLRDLSFCGETIRAK